MPITLGGREDEVTEFITLVVNTDVLYKSMFVYRRMPATFRKRCFDKLEANGFKACSDRWREIFQRALIDKSEGDVAQQHDALNELMAHIQIDQHANRLATNCIECRKFFFYLIYQTTTGDDGFPGPLFA
jgi:hypothetical protein